MRGRAVVIPQQNIHLIRIRPDDGNRTRVFRQRKQITLVFQQDDGFPCGLQSQFIVLFGIVDFKRYLRVRYHARRIEHAQTHSCCKQPLHCHIDVLLGDESLLRRRQQARKCNPAVQIRPRLHGHGRSLFRSLYHTMALPEIFDGPAVRHDISLKAPFISQDFVEQPTAPAARITHETVIGAHHGKRLPLHDAVAKMRKVGLA